MIKISHKGDFEKTFRFLHRAKEFDIAALLHKYGQKGVDALQAATPKDTGLTAGSWSYEIEVGSTRSTIRWKNSNVVNGWFNVAVALQYGHGTRNGGWVEGRDYINPAMQPVFDEIANDAFREVTQG